MTVCQGPSFGCSRVGFLRSGWMALEPVPGAPFVGARCAPSPVPGSTVSVWRTQGEAQRRANRQRQGSDLALAGPASSIPVELATVPGCDAVKGPERRHPPDTERRPTTSGCTSLLSWPPARDAFSQTADKVPESVQTKPGVTGVEPTRRRNWPCSSVSKEYSDRSTEDAGNGSHSSPRCVRPNTGGGCRR